MGYINFKIFCQIRRVVAATTVQRQQPMVSQMFLARKKNCPALKFIPQALATTTGVPYAFSAVK